MWNARPKVSGRPPCRRSSNAFVSVAKVWLNVGSVSKYQTDRSVLKNKSRCQRISMRPQWPVTSKRFCFDWILARMSTKCFSQGIPHLCMMQPPVEEFKWPKFWSKGNLRVNSSTYGNSNSIGILFPQKFFVKLNYTDFVGNVLYINITVENIFLQILI